MKKFIVLLVLLLPMVVVGQSIINYSYSDPCTGKTKTLEFLDNQTITVNYLGYIQAFDYNQINNGDLENWVNGIAGQNTSSPCAAATAVVGGGPNPSSSKPSLNASFIPPVAAAAAAATAAGARGAGGGGGGVPLLRVGDGLRIGLTGVEEERGEG